MSFCRIYKNGLVPLLIRQSLLLDLSANNKNVPGGFLCETWSSSPQCREALAPCRHSLARAQTPSVLRRAACSLVDMRTTTTPTCPSLTPFPFFLAHGNPNPRPSDRRFSSSSGRRTVPSIPAAPKPFEGTASSASTSSLCWTRRYSSGGAGSMESKPPSPPPAAASEHRSAAVHPPLASPSTAWARW